MNVTFVSSDNLNYDFLIKLRPYGRLIGIDNSSWDKFLKNSKIIQLHAILHDEAEFTHEIYQPGPTYCYVSPWNCNNGLLDI